MANLADLVEQFILKKLSGQDDQILLLRRNELAEWMDCAPSQISYVLSTRFTIERGFIVESRRGSGGFVRIARVPYVEIHKEQQSDSRPLTLDRVLSFFERLREQKMITGREAALLEYFLPLFFEKIPMQERTRLVESVLLLLADQDK